MPAAAGMRLAGILLFYRLPEDKIFLLTQYITSNGYSFITIIDKDICFARKKN
jgi:hypothetical protein